MPRSNPTILCLRREEKHYLHPPEQLKTPPGVWALEKPPGFMVGTHSYRHIRRIQCEWLSADKDHLIAKKILFCFVFQKQKADLASKGDCSAS